MAAADRAKIDSLPYLDFEVRAFWAVFVIAFLAVAAWESRRPRRRPAASTEYRWAVHGILLFGGGFVQSLILRVTPVAVAVYAAQTGWGRWQAAHVPVAARWVAAVLLLDLVHYLAHRGFHSFASLWRIHEVHHSDTDYDVSTAVRFHPLEMILGKAAYVAGVVALAAPPGAVLASELITALLNVFTHANASLPAGVERLLRTFLITPDLHRIHHSTSMAEQNRNYGQTFVIWDLLFGTYAASAAAGLAGPTGVEGHSGSNQLLDLLADPFRSRA